MKKKILHGALTTFFFAIIGIQILCNIPQEESLIEEYIYLFSSYIIVCNIIVFIVVRKDFDIFEPILFISSLYLMIFCIVPITDLKDSDISLFGVNLIGGLKKATIVFLLSYIALIFGYYFNKSENKHVKIQETCYSHKKRIYKLSICVWGLCFIASIFYLVSNGKSFMYILSLGLQGDYNGNMEFSYGFLNMFSHSLIPTWMYINIYGKNKLIKISLALLTIIVYLANGYRFILIIFILAPLIYYYIIKNCRPKLSTLLSLGGILVFIIVIIQFSRNSIKYNTTITWSEFNLDFIEKAIIGNFELYKPFYGLMNAVPNLLSYTYGQQMIYTLVMLIPRFIWPSKPVPIIYDLIGASVNEYAVKAGVAWPNIGEYYSEFGIIGSILCMFLLGYIAQKTTLLYKGNKVSEASIIAYCILLPTFLQIIIRGYTPSNFYLVLFLMVPIFLIKLVGCKVKG